MFDVASPKYEIIKELGEGPFWFGLKNCKL